MYFETFIISLRLHHSAGLKIVNKDVLPSFFFSLLLYESNYTTAFDVWSLGKLFSFVFPRVLLFPSTLSRETSGLN